MADDEQSFMDSLLAGIDSSFFDVMPSSPIRSPLKEEQSLSTPVPQLQGPSTATNLSASCSAQTRNSSANEQHEIAQLLEGAEDWDWDCMEDELNEESSNRKTSASIPETNIRQKSTLRCVVESVLTRGAQKVLQVWSERKEDSRTVILLHDWVATDVQPGDTINLVGFFPADASQITVSAQENLLILHPDVLVTATSVANASHCMRKPLLSLLLKPLSDISPSIFWGNVLHEVVQRCFTESRWDLSYINAMVDDLVEDRLQDLVRLNMSAEEAKAELKRRSVGIEAFGSRYIASEPKGNATITSSRTKTGQESFLAVLRASAIEEDISAPSYGLKGKIDVTVEACIEERTPQKAGCKQSVLPFARSIARLPFEIKTGRSIAGIEHRAQTALYSLLLEERYAEAPTYSQDTLTSQGGLLFYTQNNEVNYVAAGRHEVRGLIMTRNELSGYIVKRMKKREKKDTPSDEPSVETSFLPETINQERACSRCYVSDACMLYRKAVEGVADSTSQIADLYRLKTGHLTSAQLAFFKDWENLITLEEQESMRFRKELWTMGAEEREAKGSCFAGMILDPNFESLPGKPRKEIRIHRFTYAFVRHQGSLLGSTADEAKSYSPPSLLHGNIMSGDAVTISVAGNPHLVALSRGYVLDLKTDRIVVGVDCSLSVNSIRAKSVRYNNVDQIVFRIDKDDMTGGMSRIRDNLAQLFYVSSNTRKLELFVDLKPPTFTETRITTPELLSPSLNEGQRHAVQHALNADDYAIILGMPGTGKTTTVAELIRVLVRFGKTVLLTSYTHSAVDTILLKLKGKADFDILRVGNEDKVHPDVLEFTINAKGKPTSVEQLEARLLLPPVVATTALSIDHALFSRRRFDYCIIDEASQITLPTSLGPLRFADKAILVGDHFQLPPLVRNRDARKGGLDVSLFRRLSNAHPQAVVDLAQQYRMNADIMLLSNTLIYSGRLKCGSPEIANLSLAIPNRARAHPPCAAGSSCWLNQLLCESCKAIFVDTDALPALDSRIGDLIQNDVEASLVQQFTETLLRGGVKEEQIGIISVYRQQIKLLSRLLQPYKGIEILTADRSQGRDKDCIIISLVRANDKNEIGDLLKDWRRTNVAFTRARAKLVVFGSKKTLKASPLLEQFFNLLEEHNWVLSLPAGADKHNCGEPSIEHTQPTPSTQSMHASRLAGPKKRTLQDMGFRSSQTDKENKLASQHPPEKKAKRAKVGDALIRSRPILRDLMNNAK